MMMRCFDISLLTQFSGLLLANETVLNQIGFFLVVSVLLDTFVVRTVLVPILMSVAGGSAWWPRNIDAGYKTYGFVDTTPIFVGELKKKICGM